MTIEERVAVLESEKAHLQSESEEKEKKMQVLEKRVSDVEFKMKIIWGSLVTILSVIGVAFVNFLLE